MHLWLDRKVAREPDLFHAICKRVEKFHVDGFDCGLISVWRYSIVQIKP